jgi:DNA-binding beta-propeller fold protein YncE
VRSGLVAGGLLAAVTLPSVDATGGGAPSEWQCTGVVETGGVRQFGDLDVVHATGEAVTVNSDGLLWVVDGTLDARPIPILTGADKVAVSQSTGQAVITHPGGLSSEPHEISVVDLSSGSMDWIEMDGWPFDVAVDEVAGTAWVTRLYAGSVVVLDLATLDTEIIPVGSDPQSLTIDVVGRRVYVPVRGPDEVAVVDADTHLVTHVPVNPLPSTVAVDAATHRAFVGGYDAAEAVTVIEPDLSTATVAGAGWGIGIAADDVRGQVYVADEPMGVIDGTDLSVSTIDAPFPGADAFVDRGSGEVFIAEVDGVQVGVVDPVAGTSTAVEVGAINEVALDEAQDRVWVTTGWTATSDGRERPPAVLVMERAGPGETPCEHWLATVDTSETTTTTTLPDGGGEDPPTTEPPPAPPVSDPPDDLTG